jgi:voltage-gated potassium channel
VIVGVVLVSIAVCVLETEVTLREGRPRLFLTAEILCLVVFGAEYIGRLCAAPETPAHGGRLAYALTPSALIDLAVVVTLALPFFGLESALLRVVRVMRLLRLARLGRFSLAMALLGDAVWRRRFELGVSLLFAMIALMASASLLYVVEGGVQPEAFGSIPRAMWWSIATLTTVGYGDAVPVTGLGRILAALTALAGVGIIAIPAGLLAGAFAEAVA